MIISINWLKKFTTIDLPIDELAALIGTRLVEIEKIIDLGAKYKNVIVAKVVKCQRHEVTDHLHVTKLDDGGVVPDVERDENGYVQVVCGAPNVREGLFVAWLPPNCIVPENFGTSNPVVLDARKLRGVMSNGMIASAKELAFGDDHTGILEIDKDVAPGTSFCEVYELNDYLLDIENKSLTHRPDTFGVIGFAREVAAMQGRAFETPTWIKEPAPFVFEEKDTTEAPSVTIDNPELSDRYQAVVLASVRDNAHTPLQIQSYLRRVGVRPISGVVDVTNYLMMLTGQPLHAFDYDKLLVVSGGRTDVHIRGGRDGETLKLLDGRTIELSQGDIVIAAGDYPIGLAGAMGGADTEIDESTKNIFLESATFNLYNLRTTQMRHGIFSEAITRFTKGQPAELTAPVLAQAIRLLGEYTGAKAVTPVVEHYPNLQTPTPISLTIDTINATLGSKFMTADAIETLRNVEFTADLEEPMNIKTTAPYWRADINIPEDIIEEVGRLNGFDSIELSLPCREIMVTRPNDFADIQTRIRKILVRGGASEVLSYSFVHGDLLKKAGQKVENSYRITNSISPDLQYYRQSLTPSLLNLIHPNVKTGYENFVLFEINKTHNKIHGLDEENLPGELNSVALVTTSKKPNSGASYYEAKSYLDYLGRSLGLTFDYAAITNEPVYSITAPFEYRRSALVREVASGEFIGIVGEYRKSVIRHYKLPDHVAGFEIDPEAVLRATKLSKVKYRPLSRYPSSDRDICFQVGRSISYAEIIEPIKAALQASVLETDFAPIDIYQSAQTDTKNVTIRVKLTSHDHTLTGEEVANVISTLTSAVVAQTSATVI